MKKVLLSLFLLLNVFQFFAQEKKNISSGTITIVTNQKIKFKNLRFEENKVLFFNTETNSEFDYFINSIKTIVDSEGTFVYGVKEVVPQVVKPKISKDWIKEIDSLRNINQLRAEIILKNGDTLRTRIKVVTNLFDATLLDPMSVTRTITTIKNQDKIKYKAEEIKSLHFIDLRNTERMFIANTTNLVELLYEGKLRWCRMYQSFRPGDVSATDYIIDMELKQGVGLGGFTNRRKKLKEITKSRPDLIEFIDTMKISDDTILALLKKYNENK